MPNRDLLNSINAAVALAPVVATDNTVLTSLVIDTLGYQSCTFIIQTGTLADADADFAVEVQSGSTNVQAAHAAVDDKFLIGTEVLAGFDQDADVACRKIGYKGEDRYVSIEITPTGNAGNAPLAVVAVLGHPSDQPTANPPA